MIGALEMFKWGWAFYAMIRIFDFTSKQWGAFG